VRRLRQFAQVLEPAQEIRVLDDEAGSVFVEEVRQVCWFALPVPHHRQPHSLGVGPHHCPVLGVDEGGYDHLAPLQAVDVDGGDDRLGGGRSAVVVGGVGDLHAGQLADHRLVLEDGLQGPLADLRLVGGVGGIELAPPQNRVYHGGHEVAVGTCAEEAWTVGGGEIDPGQPLQFPAGLHFGQRWGEGEFGEATALWHVLEKILYGPDADGFQHRPPVRVTVWNKRHLASYELRDTHRAPRINPPPPPRTLRRPRRPSGRRTRRGWRGRGGLSSLRRRGPG